MISCTEVCVVGTAAGLLGMVGCCSDALETVATGDGVVEVGITGSTGVVVVGVAAKELKMLPIDPMSDTALETGMVP